MAKQLPHFLLVTFGAQGHINPSRQLARRLARTAGARVTISTSISAHRRMFPNSANTATHHQEVEEEEGLIWYVPYSDGIADEGLDPTTQLPQIRIHTSQSLTRIAADLAARGRPVTCIIYALLMTMAADVARDLSIPSVVFWIQPAAVFSIFHHYFNHGYDAAITSAMNAGPSSSFVIELPGLPALQMQDLPSFLTTHRSESSPYHFLFTLSQRVFQTLRTEMITSPSRPPKMLVNTFDDLEASVLSRIDDVEMIAVGPVVPSRMAIQGNQTSSLHHDPAGHGGGDLFEHDNRAGNYMEWLESKEDKSIVYVSFGSLAVLSKKQLEEIRRGLEECGRPYLWVVRRDVKEKYQYSDHNQLSSVAVNGGEGMVLEWCDQASVLSHRSVGCFVTHCGWNSTLESIVCGVPMVLVPQWADQPTNARLVEVEWGMGVRAKIGEEGIVESHELRRCLDVVVKENQEIRKSADMWKEKARAALGEGGSSSLSITAFVQQISSCDQVN